MNLNTYKEILKRTKCKHWDDDAHAKRHLELDIQKGEIGRDTQLPEGWAPFKVEAYTDGKQVVILYQPEEPEELTEYTHNCDEMGCSWNHVLYRGPITEF